MPNDRDDVSLAPVVPRLHAELLERWFRAPHVARWWGDPERALAGALRPPERGDHALITAGGMPAGYIRWSVPARGALDAAGLGEIPEDAIDVDIAIGEPELTGQGIGSAALALLVRGLRAAVPPPTLMICAAVGNDRALGAYEKAGFRKRRIFDDPTYGPMWLLTIAGSNAKR